MIVAEYDDFFITAKRAGVNFHSEGEAGFVVQMSEVANMALFPVHRLDKMTSGLVILAKSAEVAAEFGRMFEAREVEKYYLAISTRKPKKKQGWVKGDMAPSRRGSYKLLESMNNPAITQFISTSTRPNERLYLIKPHTGKTHQIRVALKAIGAPITGDERYSHAEEAKLEERGYLHAYALRFTLFSKSYSFVVAPNEGERFLSVEAQKAIECWSEPWSVWEKNA